MWSASSFLPASAVVTPARLTLTARIWAVTLAAIVASAAATPALISEVVVARALRTPVIRVSMVLVSEATESATEPW